MKRRVVLIVFALVVVFACAWVVLHPRELSYQGKPLSEWLERYHNPGGFGYDDRADEAVRAIGPAVIPELLRMLRTRDTDLRIRWGKLAFHYHLAKSPPVSASDRCIEAAYAFWALGAQASNAVPDLIEIYERGYSKDSQRFAASILSGIGPAAKPAVPALLRGLNNTNAPVRCYTAGALGQIRAEPAIVVPALINCITNDTDPSTQMVAANVLGNFGADARPAVPVLANALMDRTLLVVAAASLKKIAPEVHAQPELFVPALINALKTPTAQVQIWSCNELLNYGTNARPALSVLTALLVDKNPVVRIMAGRTVGQLVPKIPAEVDSPSELAPPAKALARELKNDDAAVRAVAGYALMVIGPEARPAVPELMQAMRDADGLVRYYAETALKELDPAAFAKVQAELHRTNSAAK